MRSCRGRTLQGRSQTLQKRSAIDHESVENQQSELGDLFFSLVQVARWKGLGPALGLQGTNQWFIQRLQQMEQFADRPLDEYTLVELEELWAAAKRTLGQGRGS